MDFSKFSAKVFFLGFVYGSGLVTGAIVTIRTCAFISKRMSSKNVPDGSTSES